MDEEGGDGDFVQDVGIVDIRGVNVRGVNIRGRVRRRRRISVGGVRVGFNVESMVLFKLGDWNKVGERVGE